MRRRPISPGRFDALVDRALRSIPQRFRPYLRNVVVRSDARPTGKLLRETGLGPGETLYGIYEGVPLTERTHEEPVLPDRITVFREPLLRDFGGDEDETVRQIMLTVLHEVGHHFGLEEAVLDELEDDPASPDVV